MFFDINGSQQLPLLCKANLFLVSGSGVYISGVMEDLKVWAEDERTDTGNKEKQLGCFLHVTNGSSISVFILTMTELYYDLAFSQYRIYEIDFYCLGKYIQFWVFCYSIIKVSR